MKKIKELKYLFQIEREIKQLLCDNSKKYKQLKLNALFVKLKDFGINGFNSKYILGLCREQKKKLNDSDLRRIRRFLNNSMVLVPIRDNSSLNHISFSLNQEDRLRHKDEKGVYIWTRLNENFISPILSMGLKVKGC